MALNDMTALRTGLSVYKRHENDGCEYDVREDEEQLIKFQEIVDLLVVSGYFPARIDSLSPFDKIVGGMIWCIEYCNIYIDTDLLFQENTPTIGQKISLTEKIVTALREMKCPYSIEPHQIQGFDFIHIFPVVQWLIATSLVYGKEMASHLKSYAFKEFKKQFQPEDIKTLIQTQRKVLNQLNTMQQINDTSSTEIMDNESNENDEFLRQMEISNELDKNLKELLDEKMNLQMSVSIVEDELSKLKIKNEATKTDLNAILEKFEDNKVESEEIENLIKSFEQFQEEERQLKDSCKKRMNELKIQIQQEELKKNSDSSREIEEETKAIENLKKDLTKVTRMIASLQRRMDRVIDQSELSQYQQRFSELYDQVAVKHKEMKQYFNLFNSFQDTKVYLKREISLLTSILDNYRKAVQSDSVGKEFIEQLENSAKKIKENRNMVENKLKVTEATRDDLQKKLDDLLDVRKEFANIINQLSENLQQSRKKLH